MQRGCVFALPAHISRGTDQWRCVSWPMPIECLHRHECVGTARGQLISPRKPDVDANERWPLAGATRGGNLSDLFLLIGWRCITAASMDAPSCHGSKKPPSRDAMRANGVRQVPVVLGAQELFRVGRESLLRENGTQTCSHPAAHLRLCVPKWSVQLKLPLVDATWPSASKRRAFSAPDAAQPPVSSSSAAPSGSASGLRPWICPARVASLVTLRHPTNVECPQRLFATAGCHRIGGRLR